MSESAPSPAPPAFPEPSSGPRAPVPRSNLWSWIVPLPPQGSSGAMFTVRWLATRVAFCYLLICLMLAFLQRSLIYAASRAETITVEEARGAPGSVHDCTVTSGAGDLHGWHMLPAGQVAPSPEECEAQLREARLVVLYFPGNAGNRTDRSDLMEVFARRGAHVFLFDYRGYGENPGSPSEAALVEDAHAAWKMLTDRGVPPSRVVLYGESLGGGVATRLASDLCREQTSPAGLILTATFSSLADTAAGHFPWLPVRWLLVDTFRSDDAIREVTCPILHFHGAQDSIVPITLGKKLFAAAPLQSASGIEKQFVELRNADHNDIFLVGSGRIGEAIKAFFARIAP